LLQAKRCLIWATPPCRCIWNTGSPRGSSR